MYTEDDGPLSWEILDDKRVVKSEKLVVAGPQQRSESPVINTAAPESSHVSEYLLILALVVLLSLTASLSFGFSPQQLFKELLQNLHIDLTESKEVTYGEIINYFNRDQYNPEEMMALFDIQPQNTGSFQVNVGDFILFPYGIKNTTSITFTRDRGLIENGTWTDLTYQLTDSEILFDIWQQDEGTIYIIEIMSPGVLSLSESVPASQIQLMIKANSEHEP